MKNSALFVLLILFLGNAKCLAQYPSLSAEVQAKSKVIMDEASKLSDEAWEKASVIIEQEAKQGKPYIPWASRPTDLPQAEIPAFPGAEGGGMYTYGGRGGNVYTVTSLADRGPGTLREACEKGGARIVVFNVSGIIRIISPLIIRAPYITIAGQTAPGDGVCIAGESVWINTHDVIIRHMRFRRGETFVGRRDDSIGGNPVGNIMIDHVSATWGLDENMSMYRHMYNDSTPNLKAEAKLGTVNITIQNSIFSECLDTWNHAFGSTLGGENCSFIRSIWADNAGRNPSIGWNGIFNFANNVVFNWVHRSTRGWSYGATITDPRTGEIIKGQVTLGSLRVRQDYLIFTSLLSPYINGQPVTDKMRTAAVHRLRQLAAHEVGHTLGLQHNYASSFNNRASVMDYPHPNVFVNDKGAIDFSDIYTNEIGEWDKRAITYGYQDFDKSMDENNCFWINPRITMIINLVKDS